MIKNIIACILLFSNLTPAQIEPGLQIARLKYNGGGDWYNDPSAEVNLLNFISENTNIQVNPEYVVADLSTEDIFQYPVLFMTGHGNVLFSNAESIKLREYLNNGGFLYVDDDYGLDKSFRREIKKVLPGNDLIELPFNHDIYNAFYTFENGPPKIHEHDNDPPRGFGITLNNKLVVFYTFESNPSDGWSDPEVHNDPKNKREEALKFGTNIIIYALSN
jgi:hypothetical protein